ncbi:MAG: NAD(P)/FAD-dependent oxidoreductase [Cytophagales bacterium]
MPLNIVIVGAGPVGSLLAIMMAKRGSNVTVFEKRTDWRTNTNNYSGRSINLALSARGFNALKMAGLEEKVLGLCIPMTQRAIHDESGKVYYQPYDSFGNSIKSISRKVINTFLIEEALSLGVKVHFDAEIEINAKNKSVSSKLIKDFKYDFLFGCDGVNSKVRQSLNDEKNCSPKMEALQYGYKELTLLKNDLWVENALHIWPRKKFMMIALPNLDNTFTGTLFMPTENEFSFQEASQNVEEFFKVHFNDSLPYIQDLKNQFNNNPVSGLKTVLNPAWYSKELNICLFGDSAHAIVPFYGQGLNAGFEDVAKFVQSFDEIEGNINLFPFEDFFLKRKINTDAIADLALENFVEMRDNVSDENFRNKKKLEQHLQGLFPEKWIPQYSLVTFSSNVEYSTAQKAGVLQSKYLNEIYQKFGNQLMAKEDYTVFMEKYHQEFSAL